MTNAYTAEQKRRAEEVAKRKAEQVRMERLRRNRQILAKNAQLKEKMQGGS